MKLVLGPVAGARDPRRRHARRPAGAAAAGDRRRRGGRVRARSGDRPPRPEAEQHPGRRVRRDGRRRLGPGEGPAGGRQRKRLAVTRPERASPTSRLARKRQRDRSGSLAPRSGERVAGEGPATPRPARWSARRRTCRPSRRPARPSIRAPTSTRWARSCYYVLAGTAPQPSRDAASPAARASRACRPICSRSSTRRWPRTPRRRYPSAFELADDLKRFAGGQLVAARHYSPLARAGRFVARHPVAVALAAAALLAAIAALALS